MVEEEDAKMETRKRDPCEVVVMLMYPHHTPTAIL
jgi:hypothetical protein